MSSSEAEILSELCRIDTATVGNVVATYPKESFCLGLYNPWQGRWYSDASIRCVYPELRPVAGRAVTCVFGLPDPGFTGRLSLMDVYDALGAMKAPTVLVIEQRWPPELMARAGLAGELMISGAKALGCVGLLTNGPSRDIDGIRKLGFQMLLGGITAGHGEAAVHAVNVPVSVGGMDVAPGDMIHMDENGAVKFPADRAATVLANARSLLDYEAGVLQKLRSASTAEQVRAAFTGQAYDRKKE